MIAVLYVFSYFVAGIALLLLANGMLATTMEQAGTAPAFLISAALLLFAAGAINLAVRGHERRLRPRERFLLAIAVYLVLPAMACVPVLVAMPEVSFTDAYFEAVSALTTTGWSALPETDLLPKSVLLWRALMQWMGGATILMIVIFILAPSRVGGLPDSQAGPIDYSANVERQRLGFALSRVLPLFAAATSLCFILLAVSGVQLLDAFSLASASLSTSGFTSRTAPIGDYLSDIAIWVVTLFSVLSATSFLWLRRMLRAEPAALSHRESFYVVGTVFVLGIAVAYMLLGSGTASVGASLRDGFSIAASIVSTSGLEARTGGHATLPFALLLTLIFVGGASFSTAGGIKMFRLGAMSVQSMRELVRLVYPHAIRAARFGTQAYNIQTMKAIWSLFFAALVVALIASSALGFAEVPVEQAILGGFGAVSNVAIGLFGEGNQLVRFETLPEITKIVLCLSMAVGRVEVLAAIAVLYLPFWRT